MISYNQDYQSILILILLQNNSIEINENFLLGNITKILFFDKMACFYRLLHLIAKSLTYGYINSQVTFIGFRFTRPQTEGRSNIFANVFGSDEPVEPSHYIRFDIEFVSCLVSTNFRTRRNRAMCKQRSTKRHRYMRQRILNHQIRETMNYQPNTRFNIR